MDCCVSNRRIPITEALAFGVKFEGSSKRCIKLGFEGRIGKWNDRRSIRSLSMKAAASAGSSHRAYSSVVHWPLELKSSAGKFLSVVLQNQRFLFDLAVADQLDELALERDGAVARDRESQGSLESCLHRRIAELKEQESQIVIEDVMYMLIVQKFSEIQVTMVPRLSRSINRGRLEGLPSKDKELESIYGIEVLEMVREHVATITGWRGNTNVTENWITGTTHSEKIELGRVYAGSIMYGYFLKSACFRHKLKECVAQTNHNVPLGQGIQVPLSDFHSANTWSTSLYGVSRKPEKLRRYIMGFDAETLERCAKVKSQEAVNLIKNQTCALFGDEVGAFEKVVEVTYPSLKRLVLEAVAFGSFLWEVEGHVDSVYRLKAN